MSKLSKADATEIGFLITDIIVSERLMSENADDPHKLALWRHSKMRAQLELWDRFGIPNANIDRHGEDTFRRWADEARLNFVQQQGIKRRQTPLGMVKVDDAKVLVTNRGQE